MNLATRTLGDICDEVGGIIRTGPFGTQLHETDYQAEGLPVVMPKNIIEGRISIDEIARIGDADAIRLEEYRLHAGDIVYGRRGDIGRRALVGPRENGWLCGTGCLRISLGNCVLEPAFLYYYLGQPRVVNWIANQAIGATMPNLNTSILRSVLITYPDFPTQRKIAAILSAYDDLIENNTRRIAILEEMARALYREWFVNFRFPGHETTAMVESPLGMIPEGWAVSRASDAMWINPPTRLSKTAAHPFVPMSSLSSTSMLIGEVEYREGNSGSKFKNGDTLFARITPCLENGKTAYVQFLPDSDSVACGSTEFVILRSRTLCPELVYLIARSDEFRDNAIKSMSGATGRQRVQEACFDRYLFAQPPCHVIEAFEKKVSYLFRCIHMLARKNDVLRRTRDLLLPKLISGEVDVVGLAINAGSED